MTPADILSQVRYLCKISTTDGVGSDADLLRILNDYYYRMITILVNCNEDKYGVRAKTNLATQENQEWYALPSDLMKLKRIEVTYDGTNWYKAHVHDAGEVEDKAMDLTTINNTYSQSSPYAEIFGDNIYLRPIPNTTIAAGLRIWYIQRPSLISSVTHSIQAPNEYHGYLVYGVASEVAIRQGEEQLATMMLQRWEDGKGKIEEQYSPLVLDQLIDFKPLPVSYE